MTTADNRCRVFLFTDSYPWGFGEKSFVVSEVEALLTRYDVVIVSLAPDNDYKAFDENADLPKDVEVLRWRRHSRLQRALWALAMPLTKAGRCEISALVTDGFSFARFRDSMIAYANARSLQRFCDASGVFDDTTTSLYLCFWFSTQCLALSLEKQKRPELRFLSRIHGYELYNMRNANGRQPWQRFKRSACDRIIFLDQKALRYFSESFGPNCFKGQYAINGLGVSASCSTPKLSLGQRPRVVSCSSIIPLKRIDLLAKALGTLPKDSLEWVHFGDGIERARVEALVTELDINAKFIGHVRNDEVRRYYERNHVEAFVSTSSSEGVPVSIMEALASGIPIIATDVGGVSSQVDGNGILLHSEASAEEIAEAIQSICFASSDERERMGCRSREIWAEKYDVKKNKEEFLDIVKTLENSISPISTEHMGVLTISK